MIRVFSLVFLAGLGASSAGCGGTSSSPPPPVQEFHIQELFHVHLAYTFSNQGNVPGDADELKSWATAKMDPALATRMGITSVEGAFVSPRDGQPYVVRKLAEWEKIKTVPKDKEALAPILAYESKGVNGKRFVVFNYGAAREIDEKILQDALSGKKAGKKK